MNQVSVPGFLRALGGPFYILFSGRRQSEVHKTIAVLEAMEMFLVSTRKRHRDGTFGHQKMAKGKFQVYVFRKASTGKEAQARKLSDVPVDKDILMLVHGFNNDFADVTRAYLDFQRRIRRAGFRGNIMGFTWPSYGKWYQYFGDKYQVEFATPALINFLTKFRPKLGQKALYVNTHSMGAHLLIRALTDYSRIDAIPDSRPGGEIIDEVSFFAADVSDDILHRGEDGYDAVRETRRLTSYFSNRDPVLALSLIVNRDDRLGLNGAQRPRRMPNDAFQLNCQTVIDTHSGYRKEARIMKDLVAVLNGKPSDQITGRSETEFKNTFRIGPEPDDEDFDDD